VEQLCGRVRSGAHALAKPGLPWSHGSENSNAQLTMRDRILCCVKARAKHSKEVLTPFNAAELEKTKTIGLRKMPAGRERDYRLSDRGSRDYANDSTMEATVRSPGSAPAKR